MHKEDLKFIKNNNDYFSIQVFFPIGSIHEKNGKFGISHLLEHMKFKNTKKYNNFSKILEDKSIISNAYTSKDHTSYYIKGLKNDWDEIIELMYELLFNTKIDNKDLNKEKNIISEEFYLNNVSIPINDDDFDLYSEVSLFNKKNPYNRRVIGKLENIKNITVKDLKDYNKLYLRDYIVVICCNNNLIKRVTNKCIKLFPKSEKKDNLNVKNIDLFDYSLIIRDLPLKQTKYFITFNISNVDNDIYYIDFIKFMLTGNRNGLLFKELRGNKGYIYSIESNNETYKDSSFFRIIFSSTSKNTIEIIKMIFNIIKNLKKELYDHKTLQKFKNKFITFNKFLLKNNNNYFITNFGRLIYYNRDLTIDKYNNSIKNLDNINFKKIVNGIFNFNKMGITIYGNINNINKITENIIKLIDENKDNE